MVRRWKIYVWNRYVAPSSDETSVNSASGQSGVVPIGEIAERWIGKFERSRLGALSKLKEAIEGEDHV